MTHAVLRVCLFQASLGAILCVSVPQMVIKNVGYEALQNRNRMEKAKLIFNDNGQFIFKGPIIVLRRGWLVTAEGGDVFWLTRAEMRWGGMIAAMCRLRLRLS